MNRKIWQQISDLRSEGLGVRAIARRTGVHRRTVRKALNQKRPPSHSGSRRGSVIDPYRGWLMAKLQQYPELSAIRLFGMLGEQGYPGGYSTVKACVAELRPTLKPAYLTLSFAPGECAQVDWGVWQAVDVPGGRRRLSFFAMVLCHSRMLYVEFFFGESTEHWLQAHRNAFEFFGGVPERVMVDNCKTAVLKAKRADSAAELNPVYAEFADCYGFEAVPCNPRRPNEKGRVENAVGYVKGSFLAGRRPERPEVLNPAVKHWLENTANVRMHGTTGRKPAELFEEVEKTALSPLPAGPHPCALVHNAVAGSRFRVRVDTNLYSVPCRLASRRLTVHRHADRIAVYDGEAGLVADHPRCYGRNQQIVRPEHEYELTLRMRGARDAATLRRFLELGPAAAPYIEGVRERRFEWRSHAKRINALAEIHGRDEVARTLADALEHGAFSSEYIQNMIEARNRALPDAGPLHVTRRSDLLEIDMPEPDLDIYTEEFE